MLSGERSLPFVLLVKRGLMCLFFQFLENLTSEIDSFAPPRVVQIPQSRILIVGPVGAGKSSFFNTIASVFRGHVTGQAASGCSEHSITSQVRRRKNGFAKYFLSLSALKYLMNLPNKVTAYYGKYHFCYSSKQEALRAF